MKVEFNFVPLSFVNNNDEILNLVRNSVLFSFLYSKYEVTELNHFLSSTQYGYTTSALKEGENKLLRITDIQSGLVEWEKVPYCNCKPKSMYILENDDILIARTGGTTGKSFFVKNPPKNVVFASYLIRLKINEKAEIDYIDYFLHSYYYWLQIINLKSGSAIPNVNAEKLKKILIPKCSKQQQRNIIHSYLNNEKDTFPELFAKINLIENFFRDNSSISSELDHQLELVKKLRQAFLREAMQGNLVPQDSKDEPASELLKKIKAEKEKLIKERKLKKEKELPPIKPEEIPFQIPDNWVWCRLGEVCEVVKGGLGIKKAIPGQYPLVALSSERLSHNEYQFDCNAVIVPLISSTGHGHASMNRIHYQEGKFAVGNILCCVYPKNKNIIEPKFLYHYLDNWKERFFVSKMRGAANVSLSLKSIEDTPIPLIPINDQTRFVQLMQYCDHLEVTIKQSKNQNDRLLQQVLREALTPKQEE